ncbi:MAG: hypothetical protein QOG53_535 [Frankiales bacterium]|jgi:hypothetical protein|nr:hypothetical protein [Frankiales bacterium]
MSATTRSAGAATLAGGVLSIVGNLAHPRYPDDPDIVIYRKIADSTMFAVADVLLIVAIALVIAGLIAVASNLGDDFVERSARLAVVVGGTIAIAQTGIELFGVRQQAKIFVDASSDDRAGAFWSTNALDHASSALFATFTVFLLGVAPLLIGWAMRRSAGRYPMWLAVLGIIGGAVCIVVGFMNLLTSDQGDNEIPFLVGSLLVSVWVVATGALLVRRTPEQLH